MSKTLTRGPDHTSIKVAVWSNAVDGPSAMCDFDDIQEARKLAQALVPYLRPDVNVTASAQLAETIAVQADDAT